jgi:hypothetical protein
VAPWLSVFYSKSSHYVGTLLTLRRADIASGEKTVSLDIDIIKKASPAGNANVCWDAFFVIAARNNKQDKESVLSAFMLAWTKNEHRANRWKLLAKIGQHDLILHETVFGQLLSSEDPKDWYVFIDEIIDREFIGDFIMVWTEAGGERLARSIGRREGAEWGRVERLLKDLMRGKAYEKGARF